MMDILPSPSHVAAYRFSGTLDGPDYDRCIADLESRLRLHERIGIFCDMTGFTGLTAEAMGKDLRYALSKFGEYKRFARGAILTDKQWLARISEFAGHFFPNTEIRAFAPGEHDAALAWASDVQPLPPKG
ncbi:STAS/SEC14 domain-containing protein [Lysobacter sp. LF1]|uniref:STAS/SEC14 domain-containing protein n=1 Tax=Lysobacter stagni TaxID=3045172 RepID=A0ABT6XIZ4_9GAMM|nr:STAS/SEC14 domain-containing protein [Lysobacter sp. LF1]MDI9240134.1 STAS/SEC14 domain-containing protein [Lysobacter sp. LF1]